MSKPKPLLHDTRVVIIGGGIVGCSVLYSLAKRGWTDALLLERKGLASGSTWHAAGNVTQFGHYAEITRLYVDSLATYIQAEHESGQPIDFHKTGSLRLATSQTELSAYRSLETLYKALEVPYFVVGCGELASLHPLLETKGLYGAAYTPDDGHLDPTGATNALAAVARNLGCEVRLHSPVSRIQQLNDGRWQADCGGVSFRAEYLVMAASFWSRELLLPIGLDLPIYAMEHHEIVTGEVAGLRKIEFELPAIRDPAVPSNVRQEQFSLLCGVYEARPKLWATDGIPPEFGQDMLSPDLDRLELHLERVIDRIPAFGECGIKAVNNGPLCFPPDGCPLLGPVRNHEGLWLATGFPVGIGIGGGSGRYLADWMVDGVPPYSLPIVDPDRFSVPQTSEAYFASMKATYAMGYVIPGYLR